LISDYLHQVLGDEIMDIGVTNHYNDGDVIYPADDPNVSSAYFSARRKKKGALMSKAKGVNVRVQHQTTRTGIPLPL